MTGTLRRDNPTAVDSKGDPVPGDYTEYAVQGIRENIDKFFATANGVPHTDVKFLLIMNLIKPATTPQQEDWIFMYGEWHKIRRITGIDPARASVTMSAFRTPAPPT
jgi:hypothetical protein